MAGSVWLFDMERKKREKKREEEEEIFSAFKIKKCECGAG